MTFKLYYIPLAISTFQAHHNSYAEQGQKDVSTIAVHCHWFCSQ